MVVWGDVYMIRERALSIRRQLEHLGLIVISIGSEFGRLNIGGLM